MKAYDSLTCDHCDGVIKVYKFQKKVKTFRKRMDKLLQILYSTCSVGHERASAKEMVKAVRAELLGLTESGQINKKWTPSSPGSSEKIMEKIHADLNYYSDRWSYSRLQVIKEEYKIFNEMYNYYEAAWKKRK